MADVYDLARYKSRLQELMQKSNLDIPVYLTISQDVQPEFRFKSSVVVDKVLYTSEERFPNKKAAEQHIAKVAFEGASQKIKADALSTINKDPIFCKRIVYEYAAKMNIEKPIFHTVEVEEGVLPRFTSSLVFNKVKYTGEVCRTKKNSEQLAARAVVLSTLGRSDTGIIMAMLITSMYTNKGRNLTHNYVVAEINSETNIVPLSQIDGKKSNGDKSTLQLVTSSPLGAPATRKRLTNNNQNRANKTMRINHDEVDSSDAEMEIGQVPANIVVEASNPAPSCSSVGP